MNDNIGEGIMDETWFLRMQKGWDPEHGSKRSALDRRRIEALLPL